MLLTKTPLGNCILNQPLFFSGCSSIPFFNSYFVTYGTPCCVRGLHSHLSFCDLLKTMPWQRSLLSSLTTSVTYTTPHQARGQQSQSIHPTHTYGSSGFPKGGKYPKDVPLPTC